MLQKDGRANYPASQQGWRSVSLHQRGETVRGLRYIQVRVQGTSLIVLQVSIHQQKRDSLGSLQQYIQVRIYMPFIQVLHTGGQSPSREETALGLRFIQFRLYAMHSL
jgi:hypothetical protein